MDYQPPEPMPGPSVEKTSLNLDPKLEATLSYVGLWVTGIIFYLLEKENNFVRFHAMQSIITFGGLTAVSIGLQILRPTPFIGWLFALMAGLVGVATVVLWVVLMIKAFQGERYRLPVVGDLAEKNIR